MKSVVYTALIGCIGLLMAGCNTKAPPCRSNLPSITAPSAGCLVINDQKQLLVILDYKDQINIPGGSAEEGEFAHCTAGRETWEETGIAANPISLAGVFDNGFHVFACELADHSAQFSPPFWFEVKEVLWLPVSDFDQHSWRFPDNEQWLRDWMSNSVNHDVSESPTTVP